MSKLTESFRGVGVFNAHGFYGGQPYISYVPNGGCRSFQYACWAVHPPAGKKWTNLHWMDYGSKRFAISAAKGATHKERKASALLEAQAFLSRNCGIQQYAKDPYGGYGDAEFVSLRIADLKAQAQDKEDS